MKRFARVVLILPAYFLSLLAQNTNPVTPRGEPENLADTINRLIRYHDFGEYDLEIREVVDAARDFLETRVREARKDEKLAAVFDIDETSLSNWDTMFDCGFCSYRTQLKLYPNAKGSAIIPVLELFKFARSKGVAVFFVTGRPEKERPSTIQNLTDVGYSGWTGLIMRPDGNQEPARLLKSRNRQEITDKAYRIVLNIGDQASDLAGCCAERAFKLPNPFYLVP